MIRLIFLAVCLFATPASAGVVKAVDLTKRFYQNFETQSLLLEKQAMIDCRPEALKPAYHSAFDAWVAASAIQFGPIEDIGGPLSIAFWPDKKGFTTKALKRLIQNNDPIIHNPQKFGEVSIAAKGFLAIERLLFDPAFNEYSEPGTTCALARAISKDIAHKAEYMNTIWQASFADVILTAGATDNSKFLSKKEAAQAYLTSISGALKFIETARIARPLGTFENPRPKRAEAWRSERPLRNIEVSLKTLQQLAMALADGQAPITKDEFSIALKFLPSITDKSFQSIAETKNRFKVESLLQMVLSIKEASLEELSLHLGVTTGFNALDGD